MSIDEEPRRFVEARDVEIGMVLIGRYRAEVCSVRLNPEDNTATIHAIIEGSTRWTTTRVPWDAFVAIAAEPAVAP